VEQLEVVQTARKVKPAHVVQINQIIEGWRNENGDALVLRTEFQKKKV